MGGGRRGSGDPPTPDATLATWLPILRELTRTAFAIASILRWTRTASVLKTERMGHAMPGMHGVYGHVSPGMRATLEAALQTRWEDSLRERAGLSPRSTIPVPDALPAPYREQP